MIPNFEIWTSGYLRRTINSDVLVFGFVIFNIFHRSILTGSRKLIFFTCSRFIFFLSVLVFHMWERKPSAACFSPEIAMFQFHTQKKVVLPQTSTIMKHFHIHYHDRSIPNSEDLRKALFGKWPDFYYTIRTQKSQRFGTVFRIFVVFVLLLMDMHRISLSQTYVRSICNSPIMELFRKHA